MESQDYINVENCDLCNSSSRKTIISGNPDIEGGVVKCNDCGLIYKDKRLKEEILRLSYQGMNYEKPSAAWIEGRDKSISVYLDDFKPYKKCNRLLEVGMGHGYLLKQCIDAGWEGKGIDVAPSAVKFAKEQLNLDVLESGIEDAGFSDNFFDVVIIWNVLDEVSCPSSVLKEVFRILRPGGAVFLRVRNSKFHVIAYRLMHYVIKLNKTIRDYDPTVIHLFSFNAITLRKILETHKFHVKKISIATLTWTRMYDNMPSTFSGKLLIVKLVQWFSNLIAALTFGKLLLAPSLYAVAIKPDE